MHSTLFYIVLRRFGGHLGQDCVNLVSSHTSECIVAVETLEFILLFIWPRVHQEHQWFSGKISACHAEAPGSIPG
jgi:hypothetical protein